MVLPMRQIRIVLLLLLFTKASCFAQDFIGLWRSELVSRDDYCGRNTFELGVYEDGRHTAKVITENCSVAFYSTIRGYTIKNDLGELFTVPLLEVRGLQRLAETTL